MPNTTPVIKSNKGTGYVVNVNNKKLDNMKFASQNKFCALSSSM
ncbi:hypothetical protein MIDIC_50089 [Alphaproteobacteria bacterium]